MTESRTERISPQKLAASGGRKPLSRGLCGAVGLIGLALAIDMPAASRALAGSFAFAFDAARTPSPKLEAGAALRATAEAWLAIAAPGLLALVLAVAVIGGLQVGTIRLPEARGARRTPFDVAARLCELLAPQRAVDAAIAVAMLIVLGSVGWLTLAPNVRGVLALSSAEPHQAARSLLALFGTLAFRLLLTGVALGVIDYLQRRIRHALSLRMTARELRDELREQYGDPMVRSERSRRMRAGAPRT